MCSDYIFRTRGIFEKKIGRGERYKVGKVILLEYSLKVLWEELRVYLPTPICACPHRCMYVIRVKRNKFASDKHVKIWSRNPLEV